MARSWTEAVTGASTLVEILGRRARQQGDDLAYTFLADGEEGASHLNFAELDRKAHAVAARIRQLAGGEPTPRALMLYPAGLDFVTAFFGCLYARTVAVPAYPPASRRHLPRVHAIARDARPALVLATAGSLPRLRGAMATLPELAHAAWLATDTVEEAGAADALGAAPAPDDLAFLQYTSGSTAAPKGVMVSHGNLLHNQEVIQRQTAHSEETVFVGWLPLYHDMGLIGNVLQPLYLGIRSVLMSPVAFLQKPARWLAAISRYRGTTSGGPNFAYELCLGKVTPAERAGLDLTSWSLAFSGAEPVRAATLERFAVTFAECGFRREALYPCYGMAETTLMISGGRRTGGRRTGGRRTGGRRTGGPTEPVIEAVSAAALERHRAVAPESGEDVRRVVGCGHAGSDLEVVVVEPSSGRRLGDDRVGEIWVAGPSVAQGYWNLPEITERDFRARLADGGETTFLRTGDLGFVRRGELFVTGRRKDLIIIRGRNHYPQDVEVTAERSHPALRPGCGAAVSSDVDGEERLVVIYEVHRHFKDDPEIVADAIRQAVAAVHQVQVFDVVLIRTGTVPKTSSGKIQRQAALAEYRAGTLAVVSRSTLAGEAGEEVLGAELELDRGALLARRRRRPLVEAFLRDGVAHLTRSAAAYVDLERPLASLGLDSLLAVELKNAVESRLGVHVPLAQLLEGATIAELASSVLAQLEAPGAAGRPELVAGDPDEAREHPLSHGQQALWYVHRLAPDNAAYNIRGAARLVGELDVEALRRAAAALVLRHPELRTRFVEAGEEPRALVGEEPTFELRIRDAAALGHQALEELLAAAAHRPFDLESGLVLRFAVFVLGPREHLLLLVVHHIVADFWSLGVMIRELGMLYGDLVGTTPLELEPLALTYGDFVRWQRALIAGSEGERLWGYWREQLGGELPLLDLPTDRPRPAVQTFAGDSRALPVEAGVTARLEQLSAGRGATLFMTLMAVFQVLLRRWSGQTDVLVGSPTTLRSAAELAPLVGYFVNPVVIRGDLAAVRRAPFTAFVDQIRRTTLAAFAHQEMPFPLLVERLQPPHDPSRSPLFQVMFVWQQDRLPEEEGLAGFALGEEGASFELGPLTAHSVKLADASAQFDLSLNMAELGGRLMASLEYNTDLFDGATAERMLGHLATLLAGVAAASETAVGELPLLTAAERRRLVEDQNPAPIAPEKACLHELFAAQAATTPEAEAVIGGERRLTYRQLDHAANRLAHRLRALGVGPEVPVGVCMDRRPEMIVAMLGILKAGGAYVPLDPEYPRQRLAFTLEDSRIHVLLIHREVPANLPSPLVASEETEAPPRETRVVDLAEFRPEDDAGGDALAAAPPTSRVTSRNLAYLIYTSGSTGRPKGVAMTHAGASVLVRWAAEVFAPAELRAVMASTSICFDLSVFEIFVPLCHGGRVIVAANALELPELPAAGEVTLVNTVPSAMSELVAAGSALPAAVRVVNLAGEPLARDLVEKIYRQQQVERVYNLYGPSEDTTYSTFTWVRRGDPRAPSIGRPVAGTQVYLVDDSLQLAPQGVPGELLLGGAGLARGYLGRAARTAERFVPDPFSGLEGAQLYRTGDLARYRADGELEFLGRLDHQVKVRGFRIELGEIEAALVRHEAVREAVVLAREDAPGDQQIVAYVVAEGAELDLHQLRLSLAESLPAFMVPQAMVVLPALPLTPNGKIDRKALPPPDKSQVTHAVDFVAPETEVEQMLAAMWREVLDVEEIGIYDDFFELGGHSLKATRVLSRVRETFQVDLPVRSLLEAPTIAGLEEAIARALMEEAGEEAVAEALAEIE